MTDSPVPDDELDVLARRYLAEGSVTDIGTGLRKARAITGAAAIYLEALIRREEERLTAELRTADPLPPSAIHAGWSTEEEVSKHTRIPVETLRSWRRKGAVRILPFHYVGRLVRYDLNEVDAAIRQRRIAPTGE
jgi:hypothetical protein